MSKAKHTVYTSPLECIGSHYTAQSAQRLPHQSSLHFECKNCKELRYDTLPIPFNSRQVQTSATTIKKQLRCNSAVSWGSCLESPRQACWPFPGINVHQTQQTCGWFWTLAVCLLHKWHYIGPKCFIPKLNSSNNRRDWDDDSGEDLALCSVVALESECVNPLQSKMEEQQTQLIYSIYIIYNIYIQL